LDAANCDVIAPNPITDARAALLCAHPMMKNATKQNTLFMARTLKCFGESEKMNQKQRKHGAFLLPSQCIPGPLLLISALVLKGNLPAMRSVSNPDTKNLKLKHEL
jgi:hypothetical protein